MIYFLIKNNRFLILKKNQFFNFDLLINFIIVLMKAFYEQIIQIITKFHFLISAFIKKKLEYTFFSSYN